MAKVDITTKAVTETSVLHLKDAEDNLIYAPSDTPGAPDEPVTVTVYGPGSRVHAQASAKRSSRSIDRLRKKGKVQLSADDTQREGAEFLADITAGFSANFDYSPAAGKTGREFAVAVYSDRQIGFIADQVAEHIGDWANFSKGSATS